MAPPKKGDLIKGQASLASFFSGGGSSLAAGAKGPEGGGKKDAEKKKQSASATPSPKKKGSSSESPDKSSSLDRTQVTEVKDKITVAGYKASPSSSPNKKDASPKKDPPGEMSRSATSSKYFKETNSTSGKNKNEAIGISDSSDEDAGPVQRRNGGTSSNTNSKASKSTAQTSAKRKSIIESDSDSDLDFKQPVVKKGKTNTSKPSTPAKAITGKKVSPRKSNSAKKGKREDDDDEFDDMDFDLDDDDFEMLDDVKPVPKPKSNGKTATQTASTSTASRSAPSSNSAKAKTEEVMDIDEPKTQEKADGSNPKFNWAEAKKRKDAGPAAPGSKEIPMGKPNCLAGLTLVFTGELSSLSREESTDLAKRYGAKVTSAISSKTSYVVMGVDAGKSKIEKLKVTKTKTLDEDGFLNLIAEKSAGPIQLDEATKKKMAEEKMKIEKAARELAKPSNNGGAEAAENALWTVRYAPKDVKDLVGNGSSIMKLQEWLRDWPKSLACGFKKPGKHAMNIFRAVLISGPPGIGKTSAAHIVAKLEGYTPIELNASDVRSKKLIDASLTDTINNSSLDSWYSGAKVGGQSSTGVKLTDRTVLIMDEVDGMSGGDRGGVGAINALIKKTKVPIICICNDAKNPKMKPMERTTAQLKFIKPDARQARTRLMTIAVAEKLKIEPEVMEQLIQAAQSDIRLVINMLSTWALDKRRSMDFDEGKELGAANVKPGMHTPFTLYSALSSAGMWSATSKKTLNDKADYYFQDHSFMPLMVQQNYITQNPSTVNRFSGKERDVRLMQTITKAAASISDGEVVDRMIHSSEQHWSLMPLHGIMSCVKPMSYCNGSGSFPMFSSWLGQNSKQTRLTRAATELQARMRLVTAASRFEVREQYLPYFFPRLIQPMLDAKQSGNTDAAVSAIVEFMDDYYLTTEDRDIILELGMDGNNADELNKKIPSAAKAAFTRKYNAATHPVAFYKGTDIGAKAKKLVGEPAPDVEEAVEAEEVVPDDESDAGNSDGEIDVSKDKFFKQKTAKGKGKGKK